ncbi:ribonuclease H-like domain-containing protein [Tanacetum coccineum]
MDSSSPMVLMAESSTNPCSSTSQGKSWKHCFNFAKGSCRFGNSCRYVHDANARVSNTNSGFNKGHGTSDNLTNDLLTKLLAQLGNLGMNVATSNNGTNVLMLNHVTVPSTVSGSINAFTITIEPLAFYASLVQPSQSVVTGAVNTSGQATLLTQAFTAGTLHDPTTGAWNNDTCASSHLNNFDFMTRRVLLRCDNTGDLYPVTAPSPIPSAFLASQHTWHQRLGRPGSEVLLRFVSNNVILCNKEKPPVLCHACRLGKHARLPFFSSSTIVSSCFDIVHSDVWTSPIPSLSCFKYYVLFLDHYSQFV